MRENLNIYFLPRVGDLICRLQSRQLTHQVSIMVLVNQIAQYYRVKRASCWANHHSCKYFTQLSSFQIHSLDIRIEGLHICHISQNHHFQIPSYIYIQLDLTLDPHNIHRAYCNGLSHHFKHILNSDDILTYLGQEYTLSCIVHSQDQ